MCVCCVYTYMHMYMYVYRLLPIFFVTGTSTDSEILLFVTHHAHVAFIALKNRVEVSTPYVKSLRLLSHPYLFFCCPSASHIVSVLH